MIRLATARRGGMAAALLATWCLLAGWSSPAEGKLRVVTTTTDLKAIAEAVGGDRVTVDSLLRGYQNPHDIEVRPSYMVKVQRADVFIRIGLDHDPWADPIIDGSRNRNIFRGAPGHVDASQGIPLLEVPTGKIDRSQGDIHSFGNTHYWLDPENGKTIARTIATALQRVSPKDAAAFSANLQRFQGEVERATARLLQEAERFRGAKVVTYHSSWPYFAHRFGLRVVNFVEPKPGVPPSPGHIEALIRQMRDEKVRLIIMEPFFSDRVPKLVAKETGAQLLTLPPSVGGMKGVNTYIELLEHNVRRIAEALR